MQVFVADDIGRETMTGVTVPAELGDIVNDIVMGCGKPENDTYRKTDSTRSIFPLYIGLYKIIEQSSQTTCTFCRPLIGFGRLVRFTPCRFTLVGDGLVIGLAG